MKSTAPPMTIRLDAETKRRMKLVAARLKLSSSALIRLGLLNSLSEIEARNNIPVPKPAK